MEWSNRETFVIVQINAVMIITIKSVRAMDARST
jgi:hypothetical protein